MIRFASRVVSAVFILGLCSCAETPDLFKSGHDGRVFNASTGRYEWESGSPPPRTGRPAGQSRAAAIKPEPQPNDSRSYNLQKGKFD